MIQRITIFSIILALAALIPQWTVADEVVINEFMAINNTTLSDADGDYPDWIELYNASSIDVNLADWYLTDNADDLKKWQFPATNIAPNSFLIIFASNKDRSIAGSELHTNFKLDGDGEYLALVRADGTTIVQEYTPTFPPQLKDISFGILKISTNIMLIQDSADCTAHVPTDSSEGTNWLFTDFDDSSWTNGITGVGYDKTTQYDPLINLDLESQMYGHNGTAYIRIPFEVQNHSTVASLTLRMKFDDGFAAYINGVKVTSSNAPASLDWNSFALDDRSDSIAEHFADFDLSPFTTTLVDGTNILAIHSLNRTTTSSDSLVLPELECWSWLENTNSSRIPAYFLTPTPGAPNIGGIPQLGPVITETTSVVTGITAGTSILLTAKIEETLYDISSVQAIYRIMFEPEINLALNDDGLDGDITANDGIYSGTLTTTNLAPAEMLRWRFEATDSLNQTACVPTFIDPLNSPKYFGTVATDISIDSQLPVLHTFIEDEEAADTDYGTQGSIWYLNKFYDNIFLNLHGQSTRTFNKKSYNLDFNHGYKFTYKTGQKAVKDINLLTNWADKSKCRNTVAYDVYTYAGGLGHFAFPVRVQRNGQFFSVADMVEDGDQYFLERIGLNPEGALYKMYNALTTSVEKVEKKTREYEDNSDLQALIDGLGEDGNTVYMYDNVDIPRAVHYFASHTIILNVDHGFKNYYLYIDPDNGGDWILLPWDVDLSLGHKYNTLLQYLDDTIYTDYYILPGAVNSLYKAFLNSPETKAMILRHARTLMDALLKPTGTPVEDSFLATRCSELADLVDPEIGISDADLDYAKWGSWGDMGNMRYSINRITNEYITGRRTYLYDKGYMPLAQIPSPIIDFGKIEFLPESGNQNEEFIELINSNNVAIDISGWSLAGGVNFTFEAGTVIAAGQSMFIVRDKRAFRLRTVSPKGGESRFVAGQYNGRLSDRGEKIELLNDKEILVTEITYTGYTETYTGNLRITEIMYHPQYSELEFIELKNYGSSTIDLTRIGFVEGVTFLFSGSTITNLNAGDELIVVRDIESFTNNYPSWSSMNIAGQYTGSLDDNGETITLVDYSDKTIIFSISFNNNRGWPLSPDGGGHSIIPLITDNQIGSNLDYGRNWRASTYMGGSPSAPNPAPINDIKINEFAAHTDYENPAYPDYDSNDWIEFYNQKNVAITFTTNWYLSDDINNLRKWRFSGTDTIAANSWLTIDEVTGFHSPITTGFGINKAGEQLFISFMPGGISNRIVDSVRFKGQENGTTLGRYRDGEAYWYALTPTINITNREPIADIVISEIMYHPATNAANPLDNTNDEFIEIHNSTASTINLWNDTGTWHLDGAVNFLFPPATSLASNEYLVLVGFDPISNVTARTDFLYSYGLTNGEAKLIGPWTGKLSNRGERIALEKPQAADLPTGGISWVIVDESIYFDTTPWPIGADGTGGSLSRKDKLGSGNDPAMWELDAGSPGKQMPLIVITAPLNNAILQIPFSITVTATVNTNHINGSVDHVEFWLNDIIKFGEINSEPYEATLDYKTIPAAGTNTIKAIMVDDAGSHTSLATKINSPLMPNRVWLTSPDNGTEYAGHAYGDITAEIDLNHTFDPIEIEFFDGTKSLGISSNRPYQQSIESITTHGSHNMTAVITDDYGSQTSTVHQITIYTNAPIIFNDEIPNITVGINDNISLTDDINLNGLPAHLCSWSWLQTGGPAAIAFSDNNSSNCTFSFSTGGVYQVQLILSYGDSSKTGIVTITAENSNQPNTIRYEEPFEMYATGTSMDGFNGWYGNQYTKAHIATNTYTIEGSRPLNLEEHKRVLMLDGVISNQFSGTETETNIWLDMIVEINYLDGQTNQQISEMDTGQLGILCNTNGNLQLWHCPDPINNPDINDWAIIDDIYIADKEMVRLTVNINYARDASGFFNFRLFVNNIPITNPATWFPCANTNNNFLSSLYFDGAFILDDLVVDSATTLGPWLITVSANDGGRISPSQNIYVEMNSNTNFAITASNYFSIAQVIIDNTNNIGSPTSYAFTNVVSDHSISVEFNEDVSAEQTPHWWLAQMDINFTNDFDAAELGDQDGDGMLTWEEYIAGTHPTNPASVFKIIQLNAQDNDRNIRWLNEPGRTYSIYKSTNSAAILPGILITNNIPADPSGTNTWTGNTTDTAFYWLKVTR